MQARNITEQFLNPHTVVNEFGLKPGIRVADFGSGSGDFAISIARIVGKDGIVSAIDIRISALEVLNSHIKLEGFRNIKPINGNLEKENGSKLKIVSQDFVLCSNILHQADNPFAVLKEAYRVLKPSGKLIIIDWQRQFVFGPRQRISKEEAQKLARDVGFKFERELSLVASHYGFIFLK